MNHGRFKLKSRFLPLRPQYTKGDSIFSLLRSDTQSHQPRISMRDGAGGVEANRPFLHSLFPRVLSIFGTEHVVKTYTFS